MKNLTITLVLLSLIVGAAVFKQCSSSSQANSTALDLAGPLRVTDSDFCSGVPCTEETDTCCDENLGGGQ